MRFVTVLLAATAFTLALALPAAEPDANPVLFDKTFEHVDLPTSDLEARKANEALDVPIYNFEERDIDSPDGIACHIIAYTGNQCGGNIGDPLGIPKGSHGVCVGTGPDSGSPRHSYRISAACPRVKMFFYVADGCSSTRPHRKTVGSGCHNINTGGPVRSIRAIRA